MKTACNETLRNASCKKELLLPYWQNKSLIFNFLKTENQLIFVLRNTFF